MSNAGVLERPDDRARPSVTADTRRQLGEWLDWYRQTVLLKIAGLTAEQLCTRAVPPSNLTLAGIVRHLTEVEAYWIREVLDGDPNVSEYYSSEDDPDGDFNAVSAETALADVGRYERELADTGPILATWTDPAALARGRRRGETVNMGWILIHLVEEYARHVGHMDLLREAIDRRTGD